MGGFTPKSWKDVQLIVHQGLAKTYFSVGDQFTIEKATAINATVGNTTGETSGVTSATIDISTFVAQIGTPHRGYYEFVYDGADWHYGDTASLATCVTSTRQELSSAAMRTAVSGSPRLVASYKRRITMFEYISMKQQLIKEKIETPYKEQKVPSLQPTWTICL